jgi:TolB-like protein
LKFITELKERRFAQFLTAYAAGGWIILEVVDQLVGNAVLPEGVYPIALTLFLSGLPAVAVASWFHGAPGHQRYTPLELGLLGTIAVVALGITAYVGTRQAASSSGPALALDRLDPTEDPRRIAILYFDAGGSSEEELLAAGITETLIEELSAVPALHVISRNGVAPLRGTRAFRSDSVADALQIGTLVQGRVTEADSIVEVRVSVDNARTGAGIGSTSLQAPRSRLFELQRDVAQQVAEFLRQRIGEEVQLIRSQAEAGDVEAWVHVQEAEAREEEAERLMDLEDPAGAEGALAAADSLLAIAEAEDPDWAVPPTKRGWLSYLRSRWLGFEREQIDRLIEEGLAHAGRALALDSEDADALELRATLNYWRYLLNLTSEPGEAERLFAEAERDFRASVAANPNQASALGSLSHLLMNKGTTAQAKLAAERSYEADPWLTNANVTLWRLFASSADLEDAREARKWCQEGERRFPDDVRFIECRLWLNAFRGQEPDSVAARIPSAWQLCERYVELSPPAIREFRDKLCHMFIAWALVRAELPDSAVTVARRARAGVDVDPVRTLLYYEAFVHTWLGDNDQAIELLATYLAANPSQVEALARDQSWWLEDLRDQPGFQDLLDTR